MYVFLCMIFMHILDDFCLQGILESMKQADWWRRQDSYSEMYKYDYLVALVTHAFSWTFSVMIPVVVASSGVLNAAFYTVFIANVIIHATVDDAKANKHRINLLLDQLIHLLQIVGTFFILMVL